MESEKALCHETDVIKMANDEEGERFVLFTVSFAVQYIRAKRDLSENILRSYFSMAPDYFRYMKTVSLKEVIDLLEKSRKGTFYSRDIDVLLSPEGREWLERNVPVIKRAAAEMHDE
jgi:hypothetical protein